jgi:hypothetical protein
MTACTCRSTALANPALETLRSQFWDYLEGRLSEKDFKLAVAEYSQTLRHARSASAAQLLAEELTGAHA